MIGDSEVNERLKKVLILDLCVVIPSWPLERAFDKNACSRQPTYQDWRSSLNGVCLKWLFLCKSGLWDTLEKQVIWTSVGISPLRLFTISAWLKNAPKWMSVCISGPCLSLPAVPAKWRGFYQLRW